MKTTDLHGKTALVTGAASGIGMETALLLGSRGADLAIDQSLMNLYRTEQITYDEGR